MSQSPGGAAARAIAPSDNRRQIELLLVELSARFISLPADQVDAEVENGQQRICECLGFDRSSLLQQPVDGSGPFELTHCYQVPGMPARPATVDAVSLFPWAAEQLRQRRLVAVSKLGDLPAEAAVDRESLNKYGTRSLAVVPFLIGSGLRGALTFASARERSEWSDATLVRLKLIAEVFANALARARSDRALQESEKRLRLSLAEVQQLSDKLAEQNTHLRREMKQLSRPRSVIGASRALRHVLGLAEQVAPTDSTVLLLGETGSGKGAIASAIHGMSPRRDHPMVCVNCAAIPALLLESELFGRERGAYTGALSKQVGRFEMAQGSTLFLDEIGELPIDLQVKLLRAIEEKRIERLGSPRPIRVDVRIIAATNRDLLNAVRERAFREDLYYRLSIFPITVPPLRERPEDIPLLVSAFVEEFAGALGKRIDSIAVESLEALQRYRWPGNVRELRNTIERALIVSKGPELWIAPPSEPCEAAPQRLAIAGVERDHIRRVLDLTGWRVRGRNGAAETLGLKPTTLESRMAKLGISRREPHPTKGRSSLRYFGDAEPVHGA